MAVKTSWAPGDVLAAADLTDTFAAKATYTYGTATPVAPVAGQIWMDTTNGTAVPVAKVYSGGSWVSFSGGWADFSDTPTGTYTDADGAWKYKTYTAGGTLTVTRTGYMDVLLVGAGGAYPSGSGGRVLSGIHTVAAGTLTVGLPGSTPAGQAGGPAVLGSLSSGRIAAGGDSAEGAGGTVGSPTLGVTSTITGSSVTYGTGNSGAATPGHGGSAGQTTGAVGIVVVRVRA